jgi:hypothetical protein
MRTRAAVLSPDVDRGLQSMTLELLPDEIMYVTGFAERCPCCHHALFFHFYDARDGVLCNVGDDTNRCRCADPDATPTVALHMKPKETN